MRGGGKVKCGVCGRALRSAESILIGYGPVCYRRQFGSPAPKMKRSSSGGGGSGKSDGEIPYYEIPGQMNIEDFLQSEE